MSESPPTLARAEPATSHRFAAVAIGASAGGVEVISALLAALPDAYAAAVLIVTHLSPEAPNYLRETFAYRSALPVIEPDAGEPIVAGRVYVAPPGYHMLVADDCTIELSIDAAVRFARPSIDVLFESAAHAYRERLLGILLSGANDDGAYGLEVVRALGGVAWVQAPDTAASATMPRAAIARGAADEIFSPTTIAERLAVLAAAP
jgi:two-component system chemotaxis response regulator CheB